MLSKVGHRRTGRNITPPKPSYMTDEQLAAYLADLRNNRPPRPQGSRPPPPKTSPAKRALRDSLPPRAPSAMSATRSPRIEKLIDRDLPPRAQSAMSRHREDSSPASSRYTGHALVQEPRVAKGFSPAGRNSIAWSYKEDDIRTRERQEAKSIRQALEEMDMEEEERIYNAAKDEAAELVWKHTHPQEAEKEVYAPYAYNGSPRKRTTEKSPTHNARVDDAEQKRHDHRSGSDSSSSSYDKDSFRATRSSSRTSTQRDIDAPVVEEEALPKPATGSNKWSPSYRHSLAMPPSASTATKPRIGDHRQNRFTVDCARSIFGHHRDHPSNDEQRDQKEQASNPNVESKPAQDHKILPLRSRARHYIPRVQFPPRSGNLDRSMTDPVGQPKRLHRTEIYKNPPSKSRDPGYTSNPSTPTPPRSPVKREGDVYDEHGNKIIKDGLEVRGDDIRAATSKSLRDRSPKLPIPTAVSDRPGRPIVSFDPEWQAQKVKELELQESFGGTSSKTRANAATQDTQSASVPKINVCDTANPPKINAPDDNDDRFGSRAKSSSKNIVPTINVAPSSQSRPLPKPSGAASSSSSRPLPFPQRSSTAPGPRKASFSRWTPSSVRRPTVQCISCSLPISGRILTAAGYRFHPECFRCYHCGEGLECVAFYPEPEAKRNERLARIRARQRGDEVEAQEDEGDEDENPRFYCHLDFHEQFSPRCKSCGTPIEGEVVVACGAEWHVGHFFCAECGDPFDSTTPFVEKDGYAWCVNCHTKRYSTRCRKCRRPVTDTVLKAMGFEWHEECFVCTECGGSFDDGKFFLRGEQQDPVCVKCEERRLKA